MKASSPSGNKSTRLGKVSERKQLNVRLDLTKATPASFTKALPASADVTPANLARVICDDQQDTDPESDQPDASTSNLSTSAGGDGPENSTKPITIGQSRSPKTKPLAKSCKLDLRNVMTIAAFKQANRIVDCRPDNAKPKSAPYQGSLVRMMAQSAEDANDEPTAMEKITQVC
jgi:hypothetical protein